MSIPSPTIVVQVNQHLESVDTEWHIDGDGESWWVSDNDRLRLDVLPAMVSKSRDVAESRVFAIREGARSAMQTALKTEIVRLRKLRLVNDHVRPEEIAASEGQLVVLTGAIEEARLRLDAVRLVVGTHGRPS